MGKEYIEREATLKDLELLAKYQHGERQQGILGVCETIKRKPAANVVELPCKVRDKVWFSEWWDRCNKWVKLSSPIERHVIYFSIEVDGIYAHVKDGCINVEYFGEVVFLNREDAEMAIERRAE